MGKPEIHIRPFLLNALHAFGKLSTESKIVKRRPYFLKLIKCGIEIKNKIQFWPHSFLVNELHFY